MLRAFVLYFCWVGFFFLLKNVNYFYCSNAFDLCVIVADAVQTIPAFIVRSRRRKIVPAKYIKKKKRFLTVMF